MVVWGKVMFSQGLSVHRGWGRICNVHVLSRVLSGQVLLASVWSWGRGRVLALISQQSTCKHGVEWGEAGTQRSNPFRAVVGVASWCQCHGVLFVSYLCSGEISADLTNIILINCICIYVSPRALIKKNLRGWIFFWNIGGKKDWYVCHVLQGTTWKLKQGKSFRGWFRTLRSKVTDFRAFISMRKSKIPHSIQSWFIGTCQEKEYHQMNQTISTLLHNT